MATIKYWNGSAWELAIVGKQGPAGPTGPTGPAGSASLQRFRFVATGGETSLSGTDANGNTLAYTPGLEEVFINGAAQVRGQDYTATNGTSITGLTALIATDVVEILAWGVFNVANTISNTLIDAKGDILAGSAADTVSRLAVGANDTVLTADSTTATGLKWASASAGATNWSLLNSGSTALSSAASVTFSSLSAKELLILIAGASSDSASSQITLRFNSDSGSNYANFGLYNIGGATYSRDNFFRIGTNFTSTSVIVAKNSTDQNSNVSGSIYIDQAAQTGYKRFSVTAGVDGFGGNNLEQYATQGLYNGTAAITSITILSSVGNFDAGNVYIYGAN